jgi:IS605 OrfB family transposase
MQKVIKLQSIGLTQKKQSELSDARTEAKRVIKKFILPNIDSCEDNGQLQQLVYNDIRKESYLPSQVLLNLIRSSFHLKQKSVERRNIERITLDYNIPRACKMFTLNEKKLCFAITLKPRHRIVIPIQDNGSVKRFQKQTANGWKIKQIGLTDRNEIIATIEKKKVRKDYKNILGVDTNSNNVSVTALTPKGKILKQLYLGKNLYNKKAKMMKRRAKLQSHADKGSSKAIEKLRKLSRKVSNINKNAVGEIAKQLHEIAERYKAKIVFERLHKFEANKGRDFNRKVTLIPFRMLTMTTAIRSVDTGVPMGYADSYHTSKWCSGCGSVNPPHDTNNYAIYRCRNCRLVVNSDRKASLAVAVKKFAERKEYFQFSAKRVPVNALFRGNENDAIKATENAIALSDPKEAICL